VTEDALPFNILGTLTSKVDPIDRFTYQFEIEGLDFKQGSLKEITWYIGDLEYVGGYPSGTKRILDYTFKNGENHVVTARVEDTFGKIRNFEINADIAQFVELKSGFTVDILDEEGYNLANGNYDVRTDTYIIEDIPVPHVLSLDGSKVRANSNRLKLIDVLWDLDNDRAYETNQDNIEYDMPIPGRYDLRVRYVFENVTVTGELEKLIREERISII